MKIFIRITIFLLPLFCFCQKKDAYLMFKSNEVFECPIAGRMQEGEHGWEVDNKRRERYESGYFIICDQYFQLIPNSVIEQIKAESFEQAMVMNMKQFLYEGYAMDKSERSRPYIVFNQIYILEKMEDGSYLKFKVKWVEKYID